MGTSKKKCVRCEDCYFKQNMLCALKLDAPCPTFRSAERGLRPERQLAFVFRAERTRAAYAFPQAGTSGLAPAEGFGLSAPLAGAAAGPAAPVWQ